MSLLDGTTLAEEVECLVEPLGRENTARDADPEMHRAILCQLDRALAEGRLSEDKVAEVRAALRQWHPRAVLAGYARDIIADRPALGAFLRVPGQPVDLDELLRMRRLRRTWREGE